MLTVRMVSLAIAAFFLATSLTLAPLIGGVWQVVLDSVAVLSYAVALAAVVLLPDRRTVEQPPSAVRSRLEAAQRRRGA